MAKCTINKKYACNYDSEYNYFDIDIQTEKNGVTYTEAHTVIFPAGLSEGDLAAKVQDYADNVAKNFVIPGLTESGTTSTSEM